MAHRVAPDGLRDALELRVAAVARALETGQVGLATAALVAELEVPGLPEVLVEGEVAAAELHHGVEEDPPLHASLLEDPLVELADAEPLQVLLERSIARNHSLVVREVDDLEVVHHRGGDVRAGRGEVVERNAEVAELPILGGRPEIHCAAVSVSGHRILLERVVVAAQVGEERQVQRRDLLLALPELGDGLRDLVALLADHQRLLGGEEQIVLHHLAVAAHVVSLAADPHLVEDREVAVAESLTLEDLVAEVDPEGRLRPVRAPAVDDQELAPVGLEQPVRLDEARLDRLADEHLVRATEAAGVVDAEALGRADRVERHGRRLRDHDHGVGVGGVELRGGDVAVAAIVALQQSGVGVGPPHDRVLSEVHDVLPGYSPGLLVGLRNTLRVASFHLNQHKCDQDSTAF